MSANKPRREEAKFDVGKLNAMVEPLTVRIERKRGNSLQPIQLPAKDGYPSGVGYTRDDIHGLENFLLTEWTGGGYYRGTVTDANSEVLMWEFGWPPTVYPERVPPNTVSAVAANMSAPPAAAPIVVPPGGTMATMPQPQPVGVAPPTVQQVAAAASMTGQSSAASPGSDWMYRAAQVYGPQPQPQITQPTFANPQFGVNMPAWQPPPTVQFGPFGQPQQQQPQQQPQQPQAAPAVVLPAPPSSSVAAEERARMLEQHLEELKRQKIESEYNARLEREREAHARDLAAVKEEIKRMQENAARAAQAAVAAPVAPVESDEMRRLREENERRREDAERARQKAIDDQFAMMREMMAKLAEGASKPRTDDDTREALRRMEEQRRQDLERMERERERAETQRQFERKQDEARIERAEMERRHREELQASEAKRREEAQAAELKRREEAQALREEMRRLETQNHRPNEMLEYMRESARQAADTQKEIARSQQMQMERLSTFMVNPLQIANLMRESAQGSDSAMRQVVDGFGAAFGTYRTALESIANLTTGGGPSPAVAMLQEGLQKAGDLANEYIRNKRDAAVSASQAQRETARSQAEIARAQADVIVAQQQRGLSGADGAPIAPAGAGSEQQLPNGNGVRVVTSENSNGVAAGTANGASQGQPLGRIIPAKRRPTEAEMFGPAYESVTHLRKGVADGKLTAKAVASAVHQGVAQAQEHNLVAQIPAFTLFLSEQYADLFDVLLPGVPQAFRDECTQALIAELGEGTVDEVADTTAGGAADGDEEDEDEDEEDDDDGGVAQAAQAVAQAAPPAPAAKPRRRS